MADLGIRQALRRRQELPEEAFVSVEELKQMYGDGNHDGVLPIIAMNLMVKTRKPAELP